MPPLSITVNGDQFGSLHRLPVWGAVTQNNPRFRWDAHVMAAVEAGLHLAQMLLSAVRALITTAGGVADEGGGCLGRGVVPPRLGTRTTYGLPAPRVTWMTLPTLSSFTRVAPGKAAATVRAAWRYWLEEPTGTPFVRLGPVEVAVM